MGALRRRKAAPLILAFDRIRLVYHDGSGLPQGQRHAATLLQILDLSRMGWDKEHGGILYFVNVDGHPADQYEHELKPLYAE